MPLRAERLRETVRPNAKGDWDLNTILNKEIIPAIRRLEVNVISGVQVFNLTAVSNTLLKDHVLNYVRIANAAPCTFTIPDDGVGPFGEGDWVRGIQAGAGALTIVAGSGVTINFPETLVMYKQWATFTLINVGSSTWDFDGDVELA